MLFPVPSTALPATGFSCRENHSIDQFQPDLIQPETFLLYPFLIVLVLFSYFYFLGCALFHSLSHYFPVLFFFRYMVHLSHSHISCRILLEHLELWQLGDKFGLVMKASILR